MDLKPPAAGDQFEALARPAREALGLNFD